MQRPMKQKASLVRVGIPCAFMHGEDVNVRREEKGVGTDVSCPCEGMVTHGGRDTSVPTPFSHCAQSNAYLASYETPTKDYVQLR